MNEPLLVGQKITFRSISGGKFRCNQTGEVVTNTKQYRYRKLREQNGIKKTKRKNEPPVKRQKEWWEW